MEPPGGRDSRFNLGYSMNLLSGETPPEIYGGGLGRPSTSLQQLSPRHTMVPSACGTRGSLKSDVSCYDDRGMPTQQGGMSFEASGVNDINDETYGSLQSKKSPPSNGKKTKGRVKIKMEYIENKLRRYTTFSKRKTGIMKKAYELSTLTGTQVMLLVASETGHVYTFATRKLQPMITSDAGKALIQTCLNSPDPPAGASGGDQRMSATGFEETELTYNISDEDSKENECDSSAADDDEEMSEDDDAEPPEKLFIESDSSPYPTIQTMSRDSQRSPDSSSSDNRSTRDEVEKHKPSKVTKETKSKEESESTIINQIKQMNHAIIQSNKAKAAQSNSSTSSSSSTKVSPLVDPVSSSSSPLVTQLTAPTAAQPQVAVQLPGNVKAVPFLVQSPNGIGFASVSDGMILGMMQGSSEPKLVAMPLSSFAPGIGIAMSAPPGLDKNEDVR